MAQGIILAGGFSSRTQNNKMRLSIDEKPLIIHTIEAMKPFVNKIYLITGHYDQDIRSIVHEDEKVHIVYNADYEKGMFSSVLCGVKNVTEDFFIIPGDIPFISASTYDALLKGSKPIRFPTYEGKEGHPLFISIKLKSRLLNEPVDSNLRKFRDEQDKEIILVDDPNILKDIDTMIEYKTLLDERK